jgi:ankyrin repeat protein
VTCLQAAILHDRLDIVELLVTAGADKETALIWAAEKGLDKYVDLLLTAGADKEAKIRKGVTALAMAAREGHVKCVGMLTKVFSDLEAKDKKGFTPLIWAAREGHDQCVTLLIKAGADIEAKNKKGFTVLIWAAMNGHDKCVTRLVFNGADKEARAGADSNTALIYASRGLHSFSHSECVKVLLNAGAYANAKNAHGQIASFFNTDDLLEPLYADCEAAGPATEAKHQAKRPANAAAERDEAVA